ncbi:MAG: hemerythrin [Polaromonas sp.]|nr:hemerythrin [Polaromonas sp.]
MAYFEWASDMEIDQGPIDQDHRKLVDLVNTLHTVTSEGRGQQIVDRVLGELISYTADHLRREEKLMESLKFPNLANHKVGHDAFLASIHDLKKKYDAGSITVAAQLSTVLRDWLSLHIRRSDKELLALLKKSQPRKAPSQAGQKNIKKIGL